MDDAQRATQSPLIATWELPTDPYVWTPQEHYQVTFSWHISAAQVQATLLRIFGPQALLAYEMGTLYRPGWLWPNG